MELKQRQRGSIMGDRMKETQWEKVTGKLNFDIIRIKESAVLMLLEGRVR